VQLATDLVHVDLPARLKAVISSSVRPSLKYSWSRFGLRSAKGSTAAEAGVPGGGPVAPARKRIAAAIPAASSRKTAAASHRRRMIGRAGASTDCSARANSAALA
jgi:hypothetical protein